MVVAKNISRNIQQGCLQNSHFSSNGEQGKKYLLENIPAITLFASGDTTPGQAWIPASPTLS